MSKNEKNKDEILFNARDRMIGHLQHAIFFVDSKFGEGFAKANPDFVAELVKVSAYETRTGFSNSKDEVTP